MNHKIFLILLLLLLCLGGTGRVSAQTGAAAKLPVGQNLLAPAGGELRPLKKPHAQAELLANVQAVAPGQPFLLGVRFRLDPGWHVYWLNYGDAGAATQVDFTLPAGFKTGPLQWPVPERFEIPQVISYGYKDEVLLFASVTPPASLTANGAPLTFTAKVNWLVCREQCVPGKATLTLALPVGQAEPSPVAPDFRRFAAQVPTPWQPGAPGAVNVQFSPDPLRVVAGQEAALTLTARLNAPWRLDTAPDAGHQPALYPLMSDAWDGEGLHASLKSVTAGQVSFAWPVKLRPLGAARPGDLQAVLSLPLINSQTGARRVERLSVAVPLAAASAVKLAPARPGLDAAAPTTGHPHPTQDEAEKAFKVTSPAPYAAGSSQGLSFIKTPPTRQSHWSTLLYDFFGSFWTNLLYAFIGGLILNVMPCVLPVLSLKVLSFVRQAGQDRRRIFRLGLTYALGVLVSFGVLAAVTLALKAAGTQVGQGFQFQEPRFVIIMAAVLFALALSLLGVYTIELPGVAMGGMDGLARREGYGGAFFNGILSTVLATPCTAPYLGGALGYALTQPAWVIVLFFLTTGLGLATPYVLLTAQPAWLRLMPRPGPWMETFKQAMGLVMMGFLGWLLWVIGSQLGAAGIVWTLPFLVVVGVACWMLGRSAERRPRRHRWHFRLATAIVLILVSFWFFPERYLRDFNAGATPRVPVHFAGWEPFSIERVEELVRQGRTVFVDFTADWCITCKSMEGTVLNSARVREAFARHGVVALRADWTRRDDAIAGVLRQFNQSGVPFYVIFPAGRAGQPIVLPTLFTPETLDQALAGINRLVARQAPLRLPSGDPKQ